MTGAPLLDRRGFLAAGAASLLAGRRLFAFGTPAGMPVVRFGMVTDLHYADIDPDPAPCGVVGRRFYRESLRKLREAVAVFNVRRPDFAIELGDFKDLTRGRDETLAHLEGIEAAFAGFDGPRYHVAGNHDFDCLSPEEFFSRLPNDGKPSRSGYYSFVRGGVTFIVLNACFDSSLKPYSRANPWNDANVPPEEMAWFERELLAAKGHVFVFCHQRLEDSAERNHIVKNAAAVRALMERSGKVKGVITGHQHRGGANVVNGIPYYSLRALVCDSGEGNNSFAETAIYADGSFTVTGWGRAASRGAKGEFPARGLVAHRGDAADFPENTLPAFESAVRKGAEMVELDEWRCATGELVVMHDGSVDRTTDGKGRIADLSFGEIRALDAGVRKGAAFAGTRVPTLEEALKVFPKTGIVLNIHCKTGSAAPEVAETLRRNGRLAQGVLMMDSLEDLVSVKKKCPWAKTGLVLNSDAGWARPWTEDEAWKKLRAAAKAGVEYVQMLPNCHLTAQQFKFLRDLDVRITYFAANDADTMRSLVREGYDFIFTDRYSALRPAYDAAAAEEA
ncbi:MAG: metallophosphoesterase [Kiritimatiellae bacterium]|nr:metallophosphoesterase [Kiritimatiellia bacterium]